MFYASDNKISKSPIKGGIKINENQYKHLLEIMQKGREFVIRDSSPYILSLKKRKIYRIEDNREEEIPEDAFTPEGYSDISRPSEHHYWQDGQWIRDDESYLKAESNKVRLQRNRLLADSDWTQVPDAPVDQAAWATYRQALRDVPEQAGFPEDINWPQIP